MSNALQILQEATFKYGFTAVNLPTGQADFVIKWGRQMIADEDLYYDDEGGCGRETEPHITVLYGLTDKQPSEELLKLIRETPPFTARLTGITLFENEEYDVVKFDVESEELVSLSNAIRAACPNENKYPKYVPHCTVAYVKKGRAVDLAGTYPFEADPPVPAEFEINEIIFKPAGDSEDPNRKTTRISLNRFVKEAEDPKSVFRQAKGADPVQLLKRMMFNRDDLYTSEYEIVYHRQRGHVVTTVTIKTDRYSKARSLLVNTWAFSGGKWHHHFWNHPWDNKTQLDAFIEKYEQETRDAFQIKEAAESPAAAVKLAAISRPLRFKAIPDNFYFRTPYYELVKKIPVDPETTANAVTTDLDTVRTIRFPDEYICFPPKWTVDDITSGQRLEHQERLKAITEAEDPKSVFRLAKAAIGRWVLARVYNAYGQDLKDVYYFHIHGERGSECATWTKDFKAATQFRSEAEAWDALKRVFGDDISYWQGGVDTQALHPSDVKHEAEDPKSVLKAVASDAFVIWTYDAGNHNYMVVEKRPRGATYWWTGEAHLATRFENEMDAWVALRQFYHEPDIKQFGIKVTPMAQARAYVGEAEDPKTFLRRARPYDQVTIRWVDQHGQEHSTSYYDLPLYKAEEELKATLVTNRSPYTVAKVLDVRAKTLTGLGEADEDPKNVFRRVVWAERPKCLIGKNKQSTGWSFWCQVDGNSPTVEWEWSPSASHASVFNHPEHVAAVLRQMEKEAPGYQMRVVDRPEGAWRGYYHYESKEQGPFDFLQFPSDPSVLAAKLLELDAVEKPTVL